MAASSRESRQGLLKVVWRLTLREQLATFVTGRLLTQNHGEKKILTGIKRGEKNHRAEGGKIKKKKKTALAFENRLLCCPVMK